MYYKEYTEAELKQLRATFLEMLKDFDAICKKHDITYFASAGTALGACRHQGFIPWDDDLDVAMFRKDYLKLLAVQDEFKEKYTLYSPDTDHGYYHFIPMFSLNRSKMIVPLALDCYAPGIFIDVFIFENVPDDRKKALVYLKKCLFWKTLYTMARVNFHYVYEDATWTQKVKYRISGGLKFIMQRVDADCTYFRKKYMDLIEKYDGKTHSYTVVGDPDAALFIMDESEMLPLKTALFEDFTIPVMNQNELFLKRRYGADYMKLPPEDKRVNHSVSILAFKEDDHD